MKTITLTTVEPRELKSFIVDNISEYESVDHRYDGKITAIYMKNGSRIHVKQTPQQINDLINS